MKVFVALEKRFLRTPDGRVWTRTHGRYSFWQRYLSVFDEVCIIARVADVARADDTLAEAAGPGVSFRALPNYVGAWGYLAHRAALRAAAGRSLQEPGAVIVRAPGPVADLVRSAAVAQGRPYAVEVLGDPHDLFSPRAATHPLRPYLRWHFTRQLRRQCLAACAVAYVTKHALQRRYPAADGVLMLGCSDVELDDDAFAAKPRTVPEPARRSAPALITVASLQQPYKGIDVLLQAVHRCRRQGMMAVLRVLGDGRCRPRFERYAAQLGLGGAVVFCGEVPGGEPVRRELDRADLFVLPSRTEGLPRALIEAMARGLPCVATTVGGIPELLPPEDMVPPNDPESLARKILEVCRDGARQQRMSRRNLDVARQYRNEALDEQRRAFYRHVREQTEQLARRTAA